MATSRKIHNEEYKMAIHAKRNLVGSIFVILGLYCSVVHAGPEITEKPQHFFTVSIDNVTVQINSAANNLAGHYVSSHTVSEVLLTNRLNISVYTQTSQKPSLDVQVADFSILSPKKFKKKNSIFEFAAKFNDRLQQILAYFDFSSSDNNKKNNSQQDQNKKTQLTPLTQLRQ